MGRRDECAGGDALPVVHLVGEVVLELNHGELLELIVRDILVQRRREHGGDVVHAVRKHHAVALLGAFGLVLERAKICGGPVSGGAVSGSGKATRATYASGALEPSGVRRACDPRATEGPERAGPGEALCFSRETRTRDLEHGL